MPAAPVLIGFGALAATGRVNIPLALGVIALVALSVDFGWYELGRRRGAGILASLSRVSLEPHSCMRQAHNVFARCGVSTLLAAKFVPGVTGVVALLAGRVAVSRVRFLLYDIAGSSRPRSSCKAGPNWATSRAGKWSPSTTSVGSSRI